VLDTDCGDCLGGVPGEPLLEEPEHAALDLAGGVRGMRESSCRGTARSGSPLPPCRRRRKADAGTWAEGEVTMSIGAAST